MVSGGRRGQVRAGPFHVRSLEPRTRTPTGEPERRLDTIASTANGCWGSSSAGQSSGLIIRQVVGSNPTCPTLRRWRAARWSEPRARCASRARIKISSAGFAPGANCPSTCRLARPHLLVIDCLVSGDRSSAQFCLRQGVVRRDRGAAPLASARARGTSSPTTAAGVVGARSWATGWTRASRGWMSS